MLLSVNATLWSSLLVGNATRVPKNLVNPPVFKLVNPGLCTLKNPGLTGLISGVSTAWKSVQNLFYWDSGSLKYSQVPTSYYIFNTESLTDNN